LPFTYFAASFPLNPTSAQLHRLYVSLHDQACRAVESYLSGHPEDDLKIRDGPIGSSSISYNLGLTDQSMVIIPRRAEESMISTSDDESISVGPIGLNGTVLAGTVLVKNEIEWNALKNDPLQLSRLFEAIGIPSPGFASEKL
jgi:ATP adenylyltransferase